MVFAARLAMMILAASGDPSAEPSDAVSGEPAGEPSVAVSGWVSGGGQSAQPARGVAYDGSIREELRVGNGIAVNAPSDAVSATDVVTATLDGSWSWRGNRLSALYQPTFQFPDFPNLGVSGFELLQTARIADDYHDRSNKLHLGVSQDFQYGTTDLFTLTQVGAAGPPMVQPVPSIVALSYVASTSLARVQAELTPRLKLDVSGGYQLSGGADATAQAVLPLQQGPLATAELDYRATRLDTFSSTLNGLEAQFSSGQEIVLVQATEAAARRFTRALEAKLELGWGVLSEQPDTAAPTSLYNYPIARASLTENQPLGRDRSLVLILSAELAPYIDRITANAYEHFQIFGTGEWLVMKGLGVDLQVGVSDPLYGDLTDAQAIVTANGHVFYEPNRYLRFEAGAIGVWQQPPSGPLLSQGMTYLAVILKDAGLL